MLRMKDVYYLINAAFFTFIKIVYSWQAFK